MTPSFTPLNRRRLLTTLGVAGLASLVKTPVATAQRSPFATPTSAVEGDGPAPADGPLASLLAMVPLAALDEDSSIGVPWSFIDFARQFAAHGMDHDLDGPDIENAPILPPTLALAHMTTILDASFLEEFTAAIGFSPMGVDQLLYAGNAPYHIHLLRAPFNTTYLKAAWAAAGYQPAETTSGIPAWTIGPDGEFNMTHPVQRRVIAALNNFAIVDDVVIATTTRARLNTILDFINAGEGESLLDEPATGHLVSTLPKTIVSAIAVQQLGIESVPPQRDAAQAQAAELIAIQSEIGPMPPVRGAIFAVNEGATSIDSDWSPDGTPVEVPRPHAGEMFMRLAMDSAADAEQAMAVIEQRLQRLHSIVSRVAYAEFMELVTGNTAGPVVELELLQLLRPNTWYQLVVMRDLFFLTADQD